MLENNVQIMEMVVPGEENNTECPKEIVPFLIFIS
jgi:hypothetical protein